MEVIGYRQSLHSRYPYLSWGFRIFWQMEGGFGGGGRGLFHNPGDNEEIRDAAEKDCGDQAGNPIVVPTGNKVESSLDFSSAGEMGLYLRRTYNHYWQGAGLFGKHWLSNFDYKLSFGSTSLDSCYPRPGGGTCALGSNTVI